MWGTTEVRLGFRLFTTPADGNEYYPGSTLLFSAVFMVAARYFMDKVTEVYA